jgi:hypothetical protein
MNDQTHREPHDIPIGIHATGTHGEVNMTAIRVGPMNKPTRNSATCRPRLPFPGPIDRGCGKR